MRQQTKDFLNEHKKWYYDQLQKKNISNSKNKYTNSTTNNDIIPRTASELFQKLRNLPILVINTIQNKDIIQSIQQFIKQEFPKAILSLNNNTNTLLIILSHGEILLQVQQTLQHSFPNVEIIPYTAFVRNLRTNCTDINANKLASILFSSSKDAIPIE